MQHVGSRIALCYEHVALKCWISGVKRPSSSMNAPCSMPERIQRTEPAWTGGLASTRHRSVTLDDSTTIKGLKRPLNVITGASAAATEKIRSYRHPANSARTFRYFKTRLLEPVSKVSVRFSGCIELIFHRRSTAERGGCFQQNLFACLSTW